MAVGVAGTAVEAATVLTVDADVSAGALIVAAFGVGASLAVGDRARLTASVARRMMGTGGRRRRCRIASAFGSVGR